MLLHEAVVQLALAQVDAPPETRAGSQHVFGVLTGGQVCGTRLAQDLQALYTITTKSFYRVKKDCIEQELAGLLMVVMSEFSL